VHQQKVDKEKARSDQQLSEMEQAGSEINNEEAVVQMNKDADNSMVVEETNDNEELTYDL